MHNNSDHSTVNVPFIIPPTRSRPVPKRPWTYLTYICLHVSDYFQTFLRSVGFAIATFRTSNEPPKVVITKSHWLALARCAIHVFPAVVSLALVYLNIKGYFIGSELQGHRDQDGIKLAALQIAAKIQELLIVSSMGTIIFDMIRSQLLYGDGLPLGLLVSGFNFSQLSYFYSPEFWGGVCSPGTRSLSRVILLVTVVVGGLLAVLAGPASAILMIPSQKDWLAGGGIFWMNGSDEVLWPTKLNVDYYSDSDCESNSSMQFTDPSCPSAGFLALRNHYATWWNGMNTVFEFELQDSSLRKVMYSAPAAWNVANTWSWTTHHVSANMQDAMTDLHFKAMAYLWRYSKYDADWLRHLRWAEKMTFDLKTKVPLVRTECFPQYVTQVQNNSLKLDFPPSFDALDNWRKKHELGWTAESDDIKELRSTFDTVNVAEDLYAFFDRRGMLRKNGTVHLTDYQDNFAMPLKSPNRGNSVDILIWMNKPWVPDHPYEETTHLLVCSVDARWMESKSVIRLRPDNNLHYAFYGAHSRNLAALELANGLGKKIGYREFYPTTDEMPRIDLTADWFDLVNPVLPDDFDTGFGLSNLTTGTKQTTFEHLLQLFYDPEDTLQSEFENLINMNIADAISRSGMIANRNSSGFLTAWPHEFRVGNEQLAKSLVRIGRPKESFPEPEILRGHSARMEMQAKYTGYILYASTWFEYFCCAALMVHVLFAVIHTARTWWSGNTSGAWDTVLEMLVLSQRSKPPATAVLANTSSGVKSYKSVQLVAWVEEEQALDAGSELRLRVKEMGKQERDKSLKPVAGKRYGQAID